MVGEKSYGLRSATYPLVRRRTEVLLVEDNPADIRLFQEALAVNKSDVQLEVVTNGQSALDQLRSGSAKRPDLVILDLNLPAVDGREILRAIKSDEATRSIPVVVFTSSGAEADINGSYDDYANCYIRKPANIDEYIAAVGHFETFWINVARLPNG